MAYFIFSILLLAAMLFFPVAKLIWVLSVRRLERKTGQKLSQTEIQQQLQRARFVSVFLCLLFSFVFNLSLLGMPAHG